MHKLSHKKLTSSGSISMEQFYKMMENQEISDSVALYKNW